MRREAREAIEANKAKSGPSLQEQLNAAHRLNGRLVTKIAELMSELKS